MFCRVSHVLLPPLREDMSPLVGAGLRWNLCGNPGLLHSRGLLCLLLHHCMFNNTFHYLFSFSTYTVCFCKCILVQTVSEIPSLLPTYLSRFLSSTPSLFLSSIVLETGVPGDCSSVDIGRVLSSDPPSLPL